MLSSQIRLERLRAWRYGRPWATNVALGMLGFALLCLTRQFVSENDHFTIGFSGASGWSAIVFIAAVAVVLTQPTNKWTLRIVIATAVLCRLVPLFADPFLSSDIYRYVWDGIVQHAGINPYHYVPGDPTLAYLREPNIDIFNNINRRDYARTIYPPVAQMIYFAATWISPTVTMMKAVMVGFECVTVGALVSLLRRIGRPDAQVLLYAWAPVAIWETSDAGHIDAALIAFLALALVARVRNRDALVGLFLGLAVMTKFYPLVLFPALWRRGDWKMPAAVVAVVAAGYAMYSSVGRMVFGFLGGYSKEEGLETGVRYFLLEWIRSLRGFGNFSTPMYMVLCAVVFGAITWWCWRHCTRESVAQRPADSTGTMPAPAVFRGCGMLAFSLMLLFSPHYPWYILWLLPFFTLAPTLPLIGYLMGFSYGYTTALADPGPKMFLLNEYLYGGVACLSALHFVLRRWPVHRALHPLWVPMARRKAGSSLRSE